MTDEEKSKELTRSSFAAQMAMLGYEPNGNPKDMVEVVQCKDCRWWHESEIVKGYGDCGQANGIALKQSNWFCADGERRDTE